MALKPIRINDIGVRPLIVGVVFVLLATIAVLLRMVSCRLNGRSLYADDYMIGLALVLAYGCGISNIVGIVYGGIGHHIGDVMDAQVEVFLKNLIANILLWASTLTAIKISILLFYIRIFSIRRFRFSAYVVMVIVVLWWVSVVLEEFLLCRPLAFNWDRTIEGGVCGDIMGAYIAAGIINLSTDLMVLILPIPTIMNLQLPVRTKIALTCTICLGFFVCIITSVRISAVIAYQPEDGTYSMWETAVWSQLEPTLGITCACIPLMRPVLDRFILRRKDITTGTRRARQSTRQHMAPATDAIPRTVSYWLRNSQGSDVEDNVGVMVKRDWDVHYS